MFEKIVTITMNPALDATVWLDTVDFAEPNRVRKEKTYAGGKAVNIARVMTALGTPVKALGLCGNENARRFFQLLDEDNVSHDFVQVEGITRENLTLIIPDGRLLKVNREGFSVSMDTMRGLHKKIEEEIKGVDSVLLVFAGSLPTNLSAEAYKSFLQSFRREGVRYALDNAFFRLNDIAEIKPYLIKPNLPEFRKMSGAELRTEQAIIKQAKSLTPYVEHILVSLGNKGMIYSGQEQGCRIHTPQVKVRSTVGAGDTALAAFLCALQKDTPPVEAAVYAAAAGTASVMLEGTGIVTPPLVKDMLEKVMVKGLR